LSTLIIPHAELEQKAIRFLRRRDFKEIKTEYTIEGYGRADVVAFEDGKLKAIVECGFSDAEKTAKAKALSVEFILITRNGEKIYQDVTGTKALTEKLEEFSSKHNFALESLKKALIDEVKRNVELEKKLKIAKEQVFSLMSYRCKACTMKPK